ncbi:hypothetical protein V866_002636 [Kwoniella sp. B9012]|uniref:N-acetyltransferase domain-containing protein n=1 Tax=Kwoniella europaea PYCC6329 TaxID=1423913 RepID=A0AAX4KG65_9TREE
MSTSTEQPLTPPLPDQPQNDYVRPIHPDDERVLKTLIGLGIMEGLPKANNKIILNPLCVLSILTLGYSLNRLMSFMPDENIISWFTALIGPCLASLPILGLVEYIQRPHFIGLLRRTMGQSDLVKFDGYCSEGKSKGWVFVHNDQIVGTILVDTQNPGKKLVSVLGDEEGQINEDKQLLENENKEKSNNTNLRKRKSTGTSSNTTSSNGIVQIRHLAVDSPYRQSSIPLDLLIEALDQFFLVQDQNKVIIELGYFCSKEIVDALNKVGFVKSTSKQVEGSDSKLEEPESIGLIGWKGYWMILSKEVYESKKEVIVGKK